MKNSIGRPGYTLRITALLFLFAFSLTQISGCAFKVKLVGEYDAITDRAVTELHQMTSSFFEKLLNSSGEEASYEANRDFYDQVNGDVSALIIRAKVIEEGLKRNPLTRNFIDLQKQYEDLAELHMTSPSEEALLSAEAAFEQSFRAILEQLLFLKWNQKPKDSDN